MILAFAATLLVVDVGVPESQLSDLWRGIADQWPSYLGYATSFLTIGGLWLAHNAIIRRLAFADSVIMRINLALLMVVAFLPFPTRLLAESIDRSDSERAAVLLYGGCLLVIFVLINSMWRYAMTHRTLLEPGVTDHEANAVLQATTPSLLFYAVVIVLAIFAPRAAALGFLIIAVSPSSGRAARGRRAPRRPSPRSRRPRSAKRRLGFRRQCSRRDSWRPRPSGRRRRAGSQLSEVQPLTGPRRRQRVELELTRFR